MRKKVGQLVILRSALGLCLVAGLLLFSQCTIQKRVYQKGWYVDIHHKVKSAEKETTKQLTSSLSIIDSTRKNNDNQVPTPLIAEQRVNELDQVREVPQQSLKTLPKIETERKITQPQLTIQPTTVPVESTNQHLKSHSKYDDPIVDEEEQLANDKVKKRAIIVSVFLALALFLGGLFFIPLGELSAFLLLGLFCFFIALVVWMKVGNKKKPTEKTTLPKEPKITKTEQDPTKKRSKIIKAAVFFGVLVVGLITLLIVKN